ncbi:MAG: bifunctional aspartate kinase/homoserine dehydrogenase I [Flavobacteriales bacterium]|nr:bifunctional aspartate kinase/homoserine dehydrogenase I [Flavobacteriales bacterium]
MKVLKFGGSSVGTPQRIKEICQLIKGRHDQGEKLAVVVSAFGGATDALISLARKAERGQKDYTIELAELKQRHVSAVNELLSADIKTNTEIEVNEVLGELDEILRGIFLVKEASKRSMDLIQSFGERLSALIISRYFSSQGISSEFCDARGLIRTDMNFGAAKVDISQTRSLIKNYFEGCEKLEVITGFIASSDESHTTTLGRGGSDYTAAIIAASIDAEALEIWTDVNGVLTANPKAVKNAYTIPELSYDEAMELSHFGAKVIYPPTIQPALDRSIPIYIKNTFEPEHPGTRIAGSITEKGGIGMTGLTSISDVALLTIEGSGLMGIPGTAARFFNSLGEADVNVIMITQASSEHSICVAIKESQAERAIEALSHTFRREIEEHFVQPIRCEERHSIIAMVGEGMRKHPGVAGKLFSALGRNAINVVAVAQGSSELNVTFVVSGEDESKSLNLIHDAFFASQSEKLHVFLLGVGLIGGTLLDQIDRQHQQLVDENNLDIRISGIANSRQMLFNGEGIKLENWKNQLEELGEVSSLEAFKKKVIEFNLANSVFVDCTANPKTKEIYPELLKHGIAISTANKVAASSSQEEYDNLIHLTRRHNVPFMNETNVGAGLPVIATLRQLVESGDRVHRIEAVISGSLSYIFNNFNSGTSFQSLVTDAREKGFTEPDPREDLSGNDIKRKIIILARVAGFNIEPEEVQVEALLPENCMEAPDVDSFFMELEKEAQHFKELIEDADKAGARLRYIASYEDGKAKVELQRVKDDNPFFNLASTDNMIVVYTDRYQERPLTVAGPGAGAGVTAAGVFAELIQLGNRNNG